MVDPFVTVAHLALAAQQAIFGISNVLYKLALPQLNPLTLAFARETGTAGFLLVLAMLQQLETGRTREEQQIGLMQPLTVARAWSRHQECMEESAALQVQLQRAQASDGPRSTDLAGLRSHALLLLSSGFCLWLGQVATLVGLAVYGPSGASASAAWHLTQPVWALLLGVLVFRVEKLSLLKITGIMLGFGGALWMALWVMLYGGNADSHGRSDAGASSARGGMLLFFVNAFCAAIYTVLVRILHLRLPRVSALTLVAVAYLVSAGLTLAVLLLLRGSGTSWRRDDTFAAFLVRYLCDDRLSCMEHPWGVPPSVDVVVCLAWTICVHSGLATVLQAWALKRAHPSQASFYSVLQPVVSCTLVLLLLATGLDPREPEPPHHPVLAAPRLGEFVGVVPVGLGLFCILSDALAREQCLRL
mmetsp:Transcript_78920/g.218355  ORF Transcript_78920/g.218355 Transcript_78920/m.218355 type:complete len:417 (-) Transcript_78920:86-1336(-)